MDEIPPCRYCGKPHIPGSDLPIEDIPWRKIIDLERRWLERHHRKPKCTICDRPMVCGQRESHYVCQQVAEALGYEPS